MSSSCDGGARTMAAIAVTRSDLTAVELRAAAGREKDSAASRRMLALAMVFDGADRTSAAETCGMDRQTLRDWVHRYNATGLAGLRNRKSSGRPPQTDGRSESGSRRTRREGARPRSPQGRALAPLRPCRRTRTAFRRETARTLRRRSSGFSRLSPPVGAPTASTGRRSGAPRDQRYEWAYIFGAVCPQRRTTAALVAPTANTEVMSMHLKEIGDNVAPGAHAALVLDGAGY